jgi:hypothetical protein
MRSRSAGGGIIQGKAMRKKSRSDPEFFDEAKARHFYDKGLVDWQIGMHCGVSESTIQHWREEKRLRPNGEGRLPGFLSPKDKYERPVPEPMVVKKEGYILVKVYHPMFADGYWSQPNVRPKRLGQ